MKNVNNIFVPMVPTAELASIDQKIVEMKSSSLKTEWMNSQEAADYLKVSKATLMNMSSNGQIPFYKLGRRNRYRKPELDRLLLNERRGPNDN